MRTYLISKAFFGTTLPGYFKSLSMHFIAKQSILFESVRLTQLNISGGWKLCAAFSFFDFRYRMKMCMFELAVIQRARAPTRCY